MVVARGYERTMQTARVIGLSVVSFDWYRKVECLHLPMCESGLSSSHKWYTKTHLESCAVDGVTWGASEESRCTCYILS